MSKSTWNEQERKNKLIQSIILLVVFECIFHLIWFIFIFFNIYPLFDGYSVGEVFLLFLWLIILIPIFAPIFVKIYSFNDIKQLEKQIHNKILRILIPLIILQYVLFIFFSNNIYMFGGSIFLVALSILMFHVHLLTIEVDKEK